MVYSKNYIRDKVLSFLNTFEQNDSQPWLMYVNTTAPVSAAYKALSAFQGRRGGAAKVGKDLHPAARAN